MKFRSNPNDTTKHAAGGIWDATTAAAIAANFPTVKHFWSCPQTDVGRTYLTDLLGTAHLVKPSGTILAGGDAYSVRPTQANASSTVNGQITAVGSKYLLVMAVANWGATGGMLFGDTSNGAHLSLLAANSLVDDDTTQVFGTAFTLVSGIAGRATLVRTWNGAAAATTGQAQFQANITSTITDLGDAATTGISAFTAGWGATNKWACTDAATTSLYGAAILLFTALPSDTFIRQLLAWHTYQWANGNKWISPQLQGVL